MDAERYRKKPVVIDAWKIDFDAQRPQWVIDALTKFEWQEGALDWCPSGYGMWINTLEGAMYAQIGDMLIRGVRGELYACKPEIFAMTYEPAALAHREGMQEPATGDAEGLQPEQSRLTDEQIVNLRDELLPSQGEPFDCLAFGRAVERLVRGEA